MNTNGTKKAFIAIADATLCSFAVRSWLILRVRLNLHWRGGEGTILFVLSAMVSG